MISWKVKFVIIGVITIVAYLLSDCDVDMLGNYSYKKYLHQTYDPTGLAKATEDCIKLYNFPLEYENKINIDAYILHLYSQTKLLELTVSEVKSLELKMDVLYKKAESFRWRNQFERLKMQTFTPKEESAMELREQFVQKVFTASKLFENIKEGFGASNKEYQTVMKTFIGYKDTYAAASQALFQLKNQGIKLFDSADLSLKKGKYPSGTNSSLPVTTSDPDTPFNIEALKSLNGLLSRLDELVAVQKEVDLEVERLSHLGRVGKWLKNKLIWNKKRIDNIYWTFYFRVPEYYKENRDSLEKYLITVSTYDKRIETLQIEFTALDGIIKRKEHVMAKIVGTQQENEQNLEYMLNEIGNMVEQYQPVEMTFETVNFPGFKLAEKMYGIKYKGN